MKAVITGMNGTVAPALAQALVRTGHTAVPWDRTLIPIDEPAAARHFLQAEAPDWFFHVATGPSEWAERVARMCAQQGISFLFTSSVSVFSPAQTGPFVVDDRPEPDDEYGRYKRTCEQRVQAANPGAIIARLGWQIGRLAEGNQMVAFLHRTFETAGEIEASTAWFPACSFLPDTAVALITLMHSSTPGLYHLGGNPGLSFYDIVMGLKKLLHAPWTIVPTPTPVQNSRMVDGRIPLKPITDWFG
jgi:dTDP-4-dehydrorhamnose reductase